MVSAGAMLLDQGRLDLDLGLLISGPRDWLFHQPYAREGAAGQAVVCPLLRGSSPTRGVAPKQHRGCSGVLSLRHFGLDLYPLILGAWVPKNLPRRRMVSAGAMLLDRLGPPGSGFSFIDFRAPRFPFTSAIRPRGRCWPGRGLPVATG